MLLVEAYGEWPREVITDGGGWLWAVFSFWQVEGKITWRIVRGGKRSVIEGFFGEFLKRRLKDFDCYVPARGLDSLRRCFGPSPGSTTSSWMAIFDRAQLLALAPPDSFRL